MLNSTPVTIGVTTIKNMNPIKKKKSLGIITLGIALFIAGLIAVLQALAPHHPWWMLGLAIVLTRVGFVFMKGRGLITEKENYVR